MNKNRDIENLFREKFENLDMAPSPKVWENIRYELDRNKKRRIIPLWIRLGGVAALLALMFTIGNSLWKSDPNNVNQETVVTEEKSLTPSSDGQINSNTPKNSGIVYENSEVGDKEKPSIITGHRANQTTHSKSAYVANEDHGFVSHPDGKLSLANSNALSEEEKSKKVGIEKDSPAPDVLSEIVDEEQIHKPSIFDAIAREKQEEDSRDLKDKKDAKRWNIMPNVAPVYYGSLNNASSIDPSLSGNSQTGEVNMSYGIYVSYQLNPKLSLRAGLNNVDLSYSTTDVIAATGPASRGLKGVDYGGKETVVTVIKKNNVERYEGLTLKAGGEDARLVQSINYIEVPLEMTYKMLDTRLGIHVIGGISTLFLGDNAVAIRAKDFSTTLGPANNLSDISFSTNVGIGFNYNLTKRFIFNLEPMFKYQLNPYTDTSIDFKPYYLGIYSGLSFKF